TDTGKTLTRWPVFVDHFIMIKLSALSTVSSPSKAAKDGHSNNLMSTTNIVLMTCWLLVGTLLSLMKPIGSAVAPTRSPVTS
ncbi:hypothetical protein, partial [Enterobacter hormaechei]|uniref:hypothetical protein n=1 Tax=Enterobacter hormaechei TaxID=158836 RepID=UPI003F8D0834